MADITFEYQMMQAVKSRLISEIHKTDFIKQTYEQKQELPKQFVSKVWATIDWDQVLKDIKPEMHKRICNAVVGNMETEIKKDVKSILSVDGVRQKLRMEVYPKIMQILDEAE